jgi:hypothetical protein
MAGISQVASGIRGRMLKRVRHLTHPTPARQDAPFRREGRSECRPSTCDGHAFGATTGRHGVPAYTLALRIVSSVRIAATRATFGASQPRPQSVCDSTGPTPAAQPTRCGSSPVQCQAHSATDLPGRATRDSVGSSHPGPHPAAPVRRATSAAGSRSASGPERGRDPGDAVRPPASPARGGAAPGGPPTPAFVHRESLAGAAGCLPQGGPTPGHPMRRLRPLARRLGTGPDLARMHYDHGQGGVHQPPQQKPFQAPGSFHDDQCRRPLAQRRDHRGDPRGVICYAERFAGRPHGHVQPDVRDIDPNKNRGGLLPRLLGEARPCPDVGSVAPATVRAWVDRNVTIRFGHGLFGPEAYRSVTFHPSHVPQLQDTRRILWGTSRV